MKKINVNTGEVTNFPANGTYTVEKNANGTVTLKWALDENNNFTVARETLAPGVTRSNLTVTTDENNKTTVEVTLNTDSKTPANKTAGIARYGFTTTATSENNRNEKYDAVIAQNEAGDIAVKVTKVGAKRSLTTLAEEFTNETGNYPSLLATLAEEAFAAETAQQ